MTKRALRLEATAMHYAFKPGRQGHRSPLPMNSKLPGGTWNIRTNNYGFPAWHWGSPRLNPLATLSTFFLLQVTKVCYPYYMGVRLFLHIYLIPEYTWFKPHKW
jgi:hypothetical protein